MQQFLAAVRRATADGNPYAALAIALTLPDICSGLEAPKQKAVGKRYVAWWNTYLLPTFSWPADTMQDGVVFLSGEDCYALRCAVLHQGSDDITEQHVRQVISRFRFVMPGINDTIFHRSSGDATLNLDVAYFCEELCKGVEAWTSAMSGRTDVRRRIDDLMQIVGVPDGA